MIFKRKIYNKLLKWKKEDNGSTAILIEGVRRVGKSTIVKEFAKNEYRSYILIDFNNISEETLSLFRSGLGTDKDRFFRGLQLSENTTLYERDSVIIFDEVQSFPKARQMIKYLVEDGRYDYIETGSLISLKKNVMDITIPSEEKRLMLHPMDFEEFLWAKGDLTTIPYIKESFDKKQPIGQKLHRLILNKYREYMVIGGMPQSVSAFLKSNDYNKVDDAKKMIWDLYSDDVQKIPSPNDIKISSILSAIPFMLGKKNKKFSPSLIKKGSGMSNYISSLEWLEQSRIINICRDVTEPGPIMPIDTDISKIKTYLVDTGLLITKAVEDNEKEKNSLYKSLIFDKLSINEGMFFENMVAQELVSTGHELYFHLFNSEDSTITYELDFLLRKGKNIVPVEVKSSYSKKHASFDQFKKKYNDICKEGYIIHSNDLETNGNITYIPIYMTMFL